MHLSDGASILATRSECCVYRGSGLKRESNYTPTPPLWREELSRRGYLPEAGRTSVGPNRRGLAQEKDGKGRMPTQDQGPGADQCSGAGLSNASAATTGDKNLSKETPISFNVAGT